MGDRGVLALDTPTMLSLAGVAPGTLNYWVQRGFCVPSIDTGTGRRATRYWTIRDVLVIRAIKGLRDAGCSLQNIAKVDALLGDAWGVGLADAVLVYDGRDVMVEREEGLVSLLASRGQGVFAEVLTMVTFPLGAWSKEAAQQGRYVDVAEIRERRADQKRRRGVA